MKQLLFLLLFPALAWAQYPSNGNQKITLGEQSTADGLIYRGVAATDTVRKPSIDTMAYMVLDTTTNIIWHYKKATSNAWLRVGGSITSGLTGVLPVANGGTNTSTAFTAGSVVFAGTSGTYTQDNSNLFWDDTYNRLGIGTTSPSSKLEILNGNGDTRMTITSTGNTGSSDFKLINSTGTVSYDWLFQGIGATGNFRIYDNAGASTGERFSIDQNGNVGIGTASPSVALHVVGNARITGAYDVTTGSASNVFVTTDGVLQRSTSSIKYKTDVEDYSKGLKEVMKLRPVTFKSINSNNDKTYAGFIAEELADLKLNELVENNDSGEPDAISYAYMVTLLTKAIQEQQEQISQLKKRLFILENK